MLSSDEEDENIEESKGSTPSSKQYQLNYNIKIELHIEAGASKH